MNIILKKHNINSSLPPCYPVIQRQRNVTESLTLSSLGYRPCLPGRTVIATGSHVADIRVACPLQTLLMLTSKSPRIQHNHLVNDLGWEEGRCFQLLLIFGLKMVAPVCVHSTVENNNVHRYLL